MARILLADDDAAMRSVLAATLAADGHDIVTAENGAEAFTQLVELPQAFQLLISDVQMPELDGFALAERVLALKHAPAVVLMSGHADGFARGDAVRSRLAAMLTKPVSRDVLRATVAKALTG